jgi:multicomponent K+:H+ antiporter subunit D
MKANCCRVRWNPCTAQGHQPRRRAESRGRPGHSLDHGVPRLSFIACALLIIGMPPLSGFIGKLSLISALLNPLGLGVGADVQRGRALLALLILSGLASLMAFAPGHPAFLDAGRAPVAAAARLECAPIFLLLGLSIALTFKAEPLLRYTQATADALNNPQQYVMAVLGTRAVPARTKAAMLEVQP